VSVTTVNPNCQAFSHQYFYDDGSGSGYALLDGTSDPAWLTLDQAAGIFTVDTVNPADIGMHKFKYRAVLDNDPRIFVEEDILELTIACTITSITISDNTGSDVTPIDYNLGDPVDYTRNVGYTYMPAMCPDTVSFTLTPASLLATIAGSSASETLSIQTSDLSLAGLHTFVLTATDTLSAVTATRNV